MTASPTVTVGMMARRVSVSGAIGTPTAGAVAKAIIRGDGENALNSASQLSDDLAENGKYLQTGHARSRSISPGQRQTGDDLSTLQDRNGRGMTRKNIRRCLFDMIKGAIRRC